MADVQNCMLLQCYVRQEIIEKTKRFLSEHTLLKFLLAALATNEGNTRLAEV